MQVKNVIHSSYPELEIHICNHEMNEQVKELDRQISLLVNTTIPGTNENGVQMLLPADIIRFYSEDQRVIAQDMNSSYTIHYKLYELESLLEEKQFIRISKSEIVNLKKIKRLDLDHAGTIRVILTGDIQTYTSRRNITRLKKALGIH